MKSLYLLLTIGFFLFSGKSWGYSYPDIHKTDHFVIHYNADSVPSRKDKSYTPLEKIEPGSIADGDPDWVWDKDVFGKKVRAVPFYIVDIGKNLEKALAAYVGMGIATYTKPRSSPFFDDEVVIIRHVYVCPLGDSQSAVEGETNSITGSIFIHQNVPTSTELPNKAVVLRKTCAHELLHNLTSYYYSGFLVKLGAYTDATSNAWWWESLAPQGDRLVWPGEAPYEAELFAMDDLTGIQHIIHDSWDVCNEAPNWYISSAFLSYLIHHRADTKASFAGIFKAPVKGAWNLLSYVRTSLGDYVKTSLKSKGLGQEYYDYMLWMYEQKYAGLNPKLDAMYTITLSTLRMEIIGTEVTCDFEFHKHYKKDGFYAKGVQLKGKVSPDGQLEIIGPVKGFSYPKGCINCCDFPKVMDDPKCFKMNHNPYYWKFNGKVVADDQGKTTCEGFIAAGIGPARFPKGGERLYAFSSERK